MDAEGIGGKLFPIGGNVEPVARERALSAAVVVNGGRRVSGEKTCRRVAAPRLRRPVGELPRSSKASQPLATTRDEGGSESRQSQAFAPFTEDSADRLRTLLKVREVAAYLRVSTATVYELCARGKLRHVRVLNAIRVTPLELQALVLDE